MVKIIEIYAFPIIASRLFESIVKEPCVVISASSIQQMYKFQTRIAETEREQLLPTVEAQ